MNLNSIFISGLVAGFSMLIVGAGLVPILGDRWNLALADRLLPPMSSGSMIFFLIVSLIFGVSIVWFYALIRPIFKSQLKAALVSAMVIWFFCYLLPNASLVAYGFIPIFVAAIGIAWGILEVLVAGVICFKLYK